MTRAPGFSQVPRYPSRWPLTAPMTPQRVAYVPRDDAPPAVPMLLAWWLDEVGWRARTYAPPRETTVVWLVTTPAAGRNGWAHADDQPLDERAPGWGYARALVGGFHDAAAKLLRYHAKPAPAVLDLHAAP